MTMNKELKNTFEYIAERVDKQIELFIPKSPEPEGQLYEAMRYSSLAGGKRVRAFLAVMSSALLGVDEALALRAAAAVEIMHTYTLIHDDLPSMDDATLRRGKPALHREFDIATAVLAGDALQSLSFEVMAHEDTHSDPRVRIKLVSGLARAIGPAGAAGGQMIDLIGEEEDMTLGQITRMNRMKTGALIRFACEVGAIMGRASPQYTMALRNYASDIGQAYQMTDDLLDHYGARQDTGKDTKKDAAANKSNFIKHLGPEETRKKVEILINQATQHLSVFGEKDEAKRLKELAIYLLERKK